MRAFNGNIQVLGITISAAILAGAVLLAPVLWNIQDKTTDKTSNWATFNRKTVAKYMTLPAEVQVVRVSHTATAIMGEHWSVKFRLPGTKLPEEWLGHIAAKQGKYQPKRLNRYEIDGRPRYDTWRVQYYPNNNVYVAEGGWD
jgi:hypothetical protein